MALDFNVPDEHPLDELLEDARMAAATDWEVTFVADMLEARERYKSRWRPTEGQESKLREIADPSRDDLREVW